MHGKLKTDEKIVTFLGFARDSTADWTSLSLGACKSLEQFWRNTLKAFLAIFSLADSFCKRIKDWVRYNAH